MEIEWSWTKVGRASLFGLLSVARDHGFRVAVWGCPDTWGPAEDAMWSSKTERDSRALEAFCCHAPGLIMVGKLAVDHGPSHVLCVIAHELGHMVCDVDFFLEGPSLWNEATADLVGATIAHETGSLSEKDRFRERRSHSLLGYHEILFGQRVDRLSTLCGPSANEISG